MKYIRTNKGKIYECVSEDENGYDCDTRRLPLKHALTKVAKQKFYYGVEYAIKVADAIKELCDEFVILPLDQNKRPLHHFLRTPRIDDISHFINDSHIIYGAIWTEWGLKYVAKMNSNGELELL